MIQYILRKLSSQSGHVDVAGRETVLEWLSRQTETNDMSTLMTRDTIRNMSMLLTVLRKNLLLAKIFLRLTLEILIVLKVQIPLISC